MFPKMVFLSEFMTKSLVQVKCLEFLLVAYTFSIFLNNNFNKVLS